MSYIQIYYLVPTHLIKSLEKRDIDLDLDLRAGEQTIDEVYKEISSNSLFCRKEESITHEYFTSSLRNDIVLYAKMNDEIVGALTFTFNKRDGNEIIIFNGICSPANYSGMGVGEALIKMLIKIGKTNNINSIHLECRGDVFKFYHKLGFITTKEYKSYDEDDDDIVYTYYYMMLDLSKVSGGKKTHIQSKKKSRRVKRKNTRRKLRK